LGVLETTIDPRAQSYLDARTATLAALAELEAGLDAAREGGGEREVTRHHARGKLLARERVELLVDRDSPLLELSPVAGWGTDTPTGAAVVTAIGMVAGRPCLVIASDPTVRGGTVGTGTLRKILRAQQIAHQNQLPVLGLLELNGVEPAEQPALFGPVSELVAGFAGLAAAGVPTAAAVFGGSPRLGGADLSESFDYLVGPRSAGGRRPPGTAPGRPVDHEAEDERDALRLVRRCVQRFGGGPARPPDRPGPPVTPPEHDPEDLLAVPAAEPREILARVLDGSEFDEDQPGSGPALCAGWAALHGHPVGVLAAAGPAGRAEEAGKAVRFARRAEAASTPLLLLRHGAGLPSAAESVLAGAAVPLLTVRTGPWQGVDAVAARARFRFAWPGAGVGPAGPGQAGPVGPAGPGIDRDLASALQRSGRLADDGVIDPRDTRAVLGFCLSIIRRNRS
jgi:acetyl-CoA carboxylase carboxyltransferase component